MRTNIDIDEVLLKEAMQASNTTTKKAVVDAALRLMVQLRKQERISRWFGEVQWDGDLNEMRASRFLNEAGFHGRSEWHKSSSQAANNPEQTAATD
jgi:Arc/MetJ family transcription regulator